MVSREGEVGLLSDEVEDNEEEEDVKDPRVCVSRRQAMRSEAQARGRRTVWRGRVWSRSRSKREENQPCTPTVVDRAELRWRRRRAGGANDDEDG